MMTDNELDNLFKNTFNHHEAPVPADMWQRIQPGDSKKRPVVFWWKWYTAAALFIIAGVATWWYVGTATVHSHKTITYNKENKKQSHPQTTQAPVVNNNQTVSLPQNTTVNNKTSTHPSANAGPTPVAAIHINNKKAPIDDTINLNTSALNKKNNGISDNSNHPYANNSIITNNVLSTQKSPSPAAVAINKNDTTASEKMDVIQQPVTTNDTTAQQNITTNKSTSAAAPANFKKDKKQAKLPWTIEAFATTAYADKQTYQVAKEDMVGMAAPIPLPQPKPSLWNYGAGVRLGIPITKKVIVKTGLQFAQTLQKADYQQQNVVDLIAINGFADTTRYRQIVYEPHNQQSRYNSLSIPVLVSYQTGKKIQVGATAGVVVNTYSWYRGKVPNASYSATLNAKNTYKNNSGLALYAGITVAKKIGAVEIFAEPHLQYNISSITKPVVPFKQRINTYGLSIGVRTVLHK